MLLMQGVQLHDSVKPLANHHWALLDIITATVSGPDFRAESRLRWIFDYYQSIQVLRTPAPTLPTFTARYFADLCSEVYE